MDEMKKTIVDLLEGDIDNVYQIGQSGGVFGEGGTRGYAERLTDEILSLVFPPRPCQCGSGQPAAICNTNDPHCG